MSDNETDGCLEECMVKPTATIKGIIDIFKYRTLVMSNWMKNWSETCRYTKSIGKYIFLRYIGLDPAD